MSHEQVYVNIDSAERDAFSYSTPSGYIYKLPTTLRNVNCIELMTLQMTRTEPNIHKGMLNFVFVSGQQSHSCSLPEGEVASGSALATMLQSLLVSYDAGLSVSFNESLYKLTISSATAFSFNFHWRQARLLGLTGDGEKGGGNVVASAAANGGFVLKSARAVDLAGEPYVLLFVNDYERNTGVTTALQSSFIMIPLENKSFMQRFIMCNDEKEKKGTYHLTGNQTIINDMRIRLTRSDGSPYDTAGVDHQIVFKVTRKGNKDYTT